MTRIVVTAFLPVACVWAARHEFTILRRGVALSAAQADKARQIGVVHPDKVRVLPITAEEHLDALAQAGFGVVEIFWYSQMQAGFYAMK